MKRTLLLLTLGITIEFVAMYTDVMNLPSGIGYGIGGIATLLLLAALWEKSKRDERDNMILWKSSHTALLTVSAAILGVMTYQVMSHTLTTSTLIIVGGLVVGKIIGHMRTRI